MRSYYAHLQQMCPEHNHSNQKPIFRASAIFPVINAQEVSTRLIFLNYWSIKRKIKDISMVATLRTEKGEILLRHLSAITESKVHRIELKQLLNSCKIDPDLPFTGSLEVEFFSAKPLVYPYPAVTINLYGPHFSSVVHTSQRVYNDFEDMIVNNQQCVPEAGFNILAHDALEPLIGLVNGPIEEEQCRLKFEFFNADNALLPMELMLGRLAPYETRLIYPAREADLAGFLKGKAGTLKVGFALKWIYPRLLVGNVQKSPKIISITHSYYDCAKASAESDFWLEEKEGWHAGALMAPAEITAQNKTTLYLYPIYSPGKFALDLEIYDANGVKLGEKANAAKFDGQHQKYLPICINTLCNELTIEREERLGVRVIARALDKERVPARIQISLDIAGEEEALPCNICTNLIPFIPAWKEKSSVFHWMPLLADQPASSAWILNSSPQKEFRDEAKLTLTFYREIDGRTLEREMSLPPNGFAFISPNDDAELQDFFEQQIGWMTVKSSNPYISTYYFSKNSSGAVGGDHGY